MDRPRGDGCARPGETARGAVEDRGDDYLVALAEHTRAVLASGDRHLLALATELPVLTPRKFLTALKRGT